MILSQMMHTRKCILQQRKNHSEMVVGSVARFNSKKDHVSNLHEIAFRKYIIKTHITDNTDLIYDTTSWNKINFERVLGS